MKSFFRALDFHAYLVVDAFRVRIQRRGRWKTDLILDGKIKETALVNPEILGSARSRFDDQEFGNVTGKETKDFLGPFLLGDRTTIDETLFFFSLISEFLRLRRGIAFVVFHQVVCVGPAFRRI